jgi:5'/3'-nucleotidase SurE
MPRRQLLRTFPETQRARQVRARLDPEILKQGQAAARHRPDLVLSGINSGSNIGPSMVISGTVGNVIVAITQLAQPIPAIALPIWSTTTRVALPTGGTSQMSPTSRCAWSAA